MRRIYKNAADTSGHDTLPISQGGTNASTLTQAAINLGLVTKDMAGRPGGVLILNNKGSLTKTSLPDGVSDPSTVSLYGETAVTAGQVLTLKITNYDSFTTYTATAVNGTAEIKGEDVLFTAGTTTGPASLTINDKTYAITVTGAFVNKPSLTAPTQGAALTTLSPVLQGSAFSAVGPADTHVATDWQVATDAAFTALDVNVVADAVNKTSYQATLSTNNTTYYARVRYKGQSDGYSAWSDTISFSVAAPLDAYPTAEVYMVANTASDATVQDRFGYALAVDSALTTLATGAPQLSSSVGGFTSWTLSSAAAPALAEIKKQVMPSVSVPVTIPSGGSLTFSSDDGAYTATVTSGSSVTIPAGVAVLGMSGYGAVGGTYYDPGQAYVAPSGWVAGSPATYKWIADIYTKAYVLVSGPYTYDPWPLGMCQYPIESVAINALGVPTSAGLKTTTGTYRTMSDINGQKWWIYYIEMVSVADQPGTSGYYSNPGQAYIAPSNYSTWGANASVTVNGTAYSFSGSYGSAAQTATNYTAALNTKQSSCGTALSVSSDGNYLAVGSPLNYQSATSAGNVTVYKKSSTKWTYQALLSSSLGEVANVKFGGSVALNSDGSLLAIGTGAGSASPAVEVYARSGTTWSLLSRLTDTSGAIGGGKECLAFASDNTLFVGNPTKDTAALTGQAGTNGAVLIYTKGTGYTLSSTLVMANSFAGSFGYSLSCSQDGKTLAVGNPAATFGGLSSVGTVSVFTKATNGTWSAATVLQPSDKAAGDCFGVSVSLSGSGRILLAGASSDQVSLDNPRAAIFRYEGSGWVQKKIIKGSWSSLDDGFGWSVKLSQDGTTAFVGAPFPGTSNTNGSRVYIFK